MQAFAVKWITRFYLPIVIVLASLIIQATTLKDTLDLERSNIDKGQWWLLISGHFSHLDWTHWLLNNLALVVIWELFYRSYSPLKACLEFLGLALGTGLGVYLFNPEIGWYVGLSGILHGMFAIGILGEVFQKNKLSIIVGLAFIGKIIWEQTIGITTGLLFDEEKVLVDAHLYGASTGFVIGLVYFIKRKVEI